MAWAQLSSDVVGRIMKFVARLPELFAWAASCKKNEGELRACVYTMAITGTVEFPLHYLPNTYVLQLSLPVLRDNEVDGFVFSYEILFGLRGSSVRSLVLTTRAMGTALFDELLTQLQDCVQYADIDYLNVCVSNGLLAVKRFSYNRPKRCVLLLAGHHLLCHVRSIRLQVGTCVVTKREVDQWINERSFVPIRQRDSIFL